VKRTVTCLRSTSRLTSVSRRIAAAARFAAVLLIAANVSTPAQTPATSAGWRDVTVDQYRQHLEQLDAAVADCQVQQKLKSPPPSNGNACDPGRVGPDDRVSGVLPADAQPREVRYDWLRAVLSQAEHKEAAAPPSFALAAPAKKAAAPTFEEQLAAARTRLQADEQQAAGPAAAGANYAAERQALAAILSQKAYQGVTVVSPAGRFREWLNEQLDRFFGGLMRFGSRSKWIGWTLLSLLLLGVGVALVWIFVRIERNARIKLVPDEIAANGAPSAREWQLWLKDAQAMAAKAQWRDGIHLLYWAAISRLEARRLWPADRARTPREYLALMPGGDTRQQPLMSLTHSFERTWYGGRDAGLADFDAALQLASSLGVKPE